MKWKIGRSNKIRFSQDKWCGNESLISRFPTIFNIAQKKDMLVTEVYNSSVWSVDMSRHLQDWELNEYESLLQFLANVTLNNNADKLIWELKKNGLFSVNSYYKHLAGHKVNDAPIFSTRMVWKTKAPPYVSFFAREDVKERILTIDNLMKREMVFVNRYSSWKCDAETNNHILLWCLLTYSLWCLAYGLLGIIWVMAGTVRNELLAWEGVCKDKGLYHLIPLTIIWVVWKERNNRVLTGRKNFLTNLEINGYIILVPWC